jgi:hypothetical protein
LPIISEENLKLFLVEKIPVKAIKIKEAKKLIKVLPKLPIKSIKALPESKVPLKKRNGRNGETKSSTERITKK